MLKRTVVVVVVLTLPLVMAARASGEVLDLEAEATLTPSAPTHVAVGSPVPANVSFGTTFSFFIGGACLEFLFVDDLLDPGDSLLVGFTTDPSHRFGFENVSSAPTTQRTICLGTEHHESIATLLDGFEDMQIDMVSGSVTIAALKVIIDGGETSSPLVYTIQGPPADSVLTVPPGGTLRFDETLSAHGDATAGPVEVTATSNVPGSTISIDPSAGTPTFSAAVELVTTQATPPGLYGVVVTGRSSAMTRSNDVQVQVNRPLDCSTVGASPRVLRSPDHKLRQVSLSGAVDPDGDLVALRITGVTQDEPVNGGGDGDTAPDARAGVRPNDIFLRAERTGTGDGRVYRLSFTGSDGNGATCAGKVTVGVPRSAGSSAIDSAPPSFNSFGV